MRNHRGPVKVTLGTRENNQENHWKTVENNHAKTTQEKKMKTLFSSQFTRQLQQMNKLSEVISKNAMYPLTLPIEKKNIVRCPSRKFV